MFTGLPNQSPALGTAVPGDPGPQRRKPLGAGGLHEVERGVRQRVGIGRDQHDGVADRLHQTHRRKRQIGGHPIEPLGHRQIGGRHLLTEQRESDEVGETDADLLRTPNLQVRVPGDAHRIGPQLVAQSGGDEVSQDLRLEIRYAPHLHRVPQGHLGVIARRLEPLLQERVRGVGDRPEVAAEDPGGREDFRSRRAPDPGTA